MSPDASPARPVYAKVKQDARCFQIPRVGGAATAMFMITVNEGWRTSIVCADMYEWAADWLLGVLGNRPFAPQERP